jgi:sugar phosphate isomerase/epimerase
VSSSCVKADAIKDSVSTLAKEGFVNIELSGGTRLYDGFENDLLELRNQYSLQYLLHNYFPPPSSPFMLNLASLNDDLYYQSLEHCKGAIALCKRLGSEKYGVHAGFLIDFIPEEAGKKISYRKLNNRSQALNRFCDAWRVLTEEAGSDVSLYIENNVFSKTNATTYGDDNPFFLTSFDGYMEMNDQLDFNILLDLAHLKVSSNSLGLNFESQVQSMILLTDYLHVSGNDGMHDQNHGVVDDSEITAVLEHCDLSQKTITLEVYDGMHSIVSSYNYLQGLGT